MVKNWPVLGPFGAVALSYMGGALGPRWIGWFSLVITIMFVVMAFLPFFILAPALLWVLVVGIGLMLTRDVHSEVANTAV